MQSAFRATRQYNASARPSRTSTVHTRALFGFMGQTSSASKGWQASQGSEQRKISKAGYDVTPLSAEARKAAGAKLSKTAQYITLDHGTERAFTGSTVNGYKHDNKQKGVYVCALGGLPLFTSDAKFDSGTGWPSFYAPFDKDHVLEVVDTSIAFMPRTEVLCARSGAHLGHVFNDGPRPTGLRYCINAAALKFIPEGEALPEDSKPIN